MHTFSTVVQKTSLYRNLLSVYLRPQKGRVLNMSVLLLVGIAFQLVGPQVIRYFIDTAELGGTQQKLLLAAAAYIFFTLLQQGLSLLAQYTSLLVGWSATNRLRTDLMLHLLRLDMPFHKQHTPGELIERVDGDVTQLANFFSKFAIHVFGNGVLIAGILILLFRENAWAGLGITIYTLATLAVLGLIQKIGVQRWAKARQASAEQFGYLEERIAGAEEIQTIGAEPYALVMLFERMRSFLTAYRAAYVVGSLTHHLTNILYVIGFAAGLGIGAYLYLRGDATLGTAYLFTSYVGMLSDPLQNLREQAQDLQSSSASLDRVLSLLRLEPEVITSSASTMPLPEGALSVSFENVSFHYEQNANVLQDVRFSLAPGKTLGILGRTGSGKSTLTRLMFRLYDPSQGTIRLGDVDSCQIALPELRRRVGMVTQDVQLFQASLRDNLTFFQGDIQPKQIEQVLRELRLWQWVESLPAGLDTVLGTGGQGLSAGEAQLLAFARVFLKDPGLVILDEASSRLDPATETLMERAIDQLFSGRTGIIIAHRLKTVRRADDILILEDGRVVEYGPRAALANDPNSRFYHLLQTGLEEVLAV